MNLFTKRKHIHRLVLAKAALKDKCITSESVIHRLIDHTALSDHLIQED